MLTTLLKLLPVVGSIVAKSDDFIGWFNDAKAMLSPQDQETAQAALADIQADNDEGHARLQAKLQAAAQAG